MNKKGQEHSKEKIYDFKFELRESATKIGRKEGLATENEIKKDGATKRVLRARENGTEERKIKI